MSTNVRFRPIRSRRENGRRFPLLVSLLAGAPLVLGGCASLTDTLKLKNTVLIKVPSKKEIASAKAEGWEFRHMMDGPKGDWQSGQWYVAWNRGHPLNSGPFSPYWWNVFRRAPEIADAARTALGEYPLLIEPNRTFSRVVAKQPPELSKAEADAIVRGAPRELVINKGTTRAWPDVRNADGSPDPLWHLGDRFTELARARARAGVPPAGWRVRIGHLDNGFDSRHAGIPKHLVPVDYRANAVGLLTYLQCLGPVPPLPGETGASHGLGTMGILAGGPVTIRNPNGKAAADHGPLGGAPEAEILSVRVAPWVASFNTAELAYSIDYASRRQRCDVISMSHGGAPTQAWVDAVNAAYERGTAMFAAESDFFSLLGNPFRPQGIILPSSPAYPAAFRRVVGVTGVTAAGESYGRNSYGRLLRAPLAIAEWAARGSYGADGTSTVLYRPDTSPDPSQRYNQGTLRPHPISAYAPNIAWLSLREKNGRRTADGVDLDGGGTSASTPQAAAAAALWLQYHRGEFTEREWRSWRKAEAVYFALLKTADRGKRIDADPYLGAGILKANRALDISYADAQRAKKPAGMKNPPPGSLYYGWTRDDYFDGAHSLLSFFGLQTAKKVYLRDRATLWQKTVPGENRTDALTRLYYNLGLLREWHGGDLPERKYQELYWERAKARASRAAKS